MARQGEESDDESVEVSQKESAKEWFTPGERRQTNLRVLEWLRAEKNRPKTRQELLQQMKRFCFILTYVQWQALLAILAELQIIVPINETTKEVEWHLDVLKDAELPDQNELGVVFQTAKKLLLTMVERKEPLPSHGPEIRRLLEPLCEVRHELEPEEILHELVMTEFVEITENGVHYNEAKLLQRETNWYAIAAMVVLLLSVSAALLDAMSRR